MYGSRRRRLNKDVKELKELTSILTAAAKISLSDALLQGRISLLDHVDGDEVVDEHGNTVIWTPEIRAQVEQEIADIEMVLSKLSQ